MTEINYFKPDELNNLNISLALSICKYLYSLDYKYIAIDINGEMWASKYNKPKFVCDFIDENTDFLSCDLVGDISDIVFSGFIRSSLYDLELISKYSYKL